MTHINKRALTALNPITRPDPRTLVRRRNPPLDRLFSVPPSSSPDSEAAKPREVVDRLFILFARIDTRAHAYGVHAHMHTLCLLVFLHLEATDFFFASVLYLPPYPPHCLDSPLPPLSYCRHRSRPHKSSCANISYPAPSHRSNLS